jgi:hypothetical protein
VVVISSVVGTGVPELIELFADHVELSRAGQGPIESGPGEAS